MTKNVFHINEISNYVKSDYFDIWVEPKNIIDINKKYIAERAENFYIKNHNISDSNLDGDGLIIYDYILGYLHKNGFPASLTIDDILDFSLYVISELRLPLSYHLAWFILPLLNSKKLDNVFEKINNYFCNEKNIHTKNLLRVFLCEVFQYGMGWGHNFNGNYSLLNQSNREKLESVDSFRTKYTHLY